MYKERILNNMNKIQLNNLIDKFHLQELHLNSLNMLFMSIKSS